MIEVVSYPEDLSTWSPEHVQVSPGSQAATEEMAVESKEFFLELYGETSPQVDTNYAQVVPAGNLDGAPQTLQAAPIYEYWWTIGHTGFSDHREHFWDHLGEKAPAHDLWHDLHDYPAARVYMFFPIDAGWRIKELASTVKYLTPTRGQESLMDKASKHWTTAAPLVADASQVAGALSAVPGVGVAAAGASTLLSALSKLQINNLPQADGFEWATAKVASKINVSSDSENPHHKVMQGIMWTLPKKMFTDLGGRITGSVALSFIPAQSQQKQPSSSETNVSTAGAEVTLGPGGIRAHAVVYSAKETVWVPGIRQFIELRIHPVQPPTAERSSG